jgi:hypothetical protein
MIMSLTITANYSANCTECSAELDTICRSAVRDSQVGKIVLTEGSRHCHPTVKGLRLETSADARTSIDVQGSVPPSGELFECGSQERALNGFDADV